MLRAVAMPEAEQRHRIGAMRRRVLRHDVQRWAGSYLRAPAGA